MSSFDLRYVHEAGTAADEETTGEGQLWDTLGKRTPLHRHKIMPDRAVFKVSVEKTNTKVITTTNQNWSKQRNNQSEFLVITRNLLKAREK